MIKYCIINKILWYNVLVIIYGGVLMDAFIELLGFLGCLVCIVLSIVSRFKKNKQKSNKFSLGLVFCVLLFIIGVAISPSSQSSDKSYENATTNSSNSAPLTTAPAKTKTSVSGNIKLHFINVGQADSILVQDGNKTMLIDAGNNDDDATVINYIKSQGISKLDVVIGKVISTFEIGEVYLPKQQSTTKTFMDVLMAIKSKGLKITTPTPGATIKLNNAEALILAPNSEKYEDINNSSIAIRLTYGSNSFLLMGDAEDISEHEILNKGFNVSGDLLKLGHHGSSSSTSQDFLNKVNPKYAVVSVGKGNTYGHPTEVTMDKLQSKGIEVYRTDECSTIVATSDGTNITFNTKEGSYNYASANSVSNAAPAPTFQPTPTPTSERSNDKIVYYVSSGKSYHYNKDCSTLKRSKTILECKLSDVINIGKSDPCDKCVH
jgi:competence protein ComEC